MNTGGQSHLSETCRTILKDVRAWICDTFPERQIYIRSEGRVQFFTFGPLMQAVMALAGVGFLGWVAFASVNVIFKDRIISAKEKHYHDMQAAYENRVADLEHSYDEVNTALVASDDRFRNVARELQAKQNTILRFLGATHQDGAALASMGKNSHSAKPGQPAGNADGNADDKPDITDLTNKDALRNLPPPAHKTEKTSSLQLDSVGRFAQAVFGHHGRHAMTISENTMQRHPALSRLSQQTAEVRQIGTHETQLMAQAGGVADRGIDQIDHLLKRTGINPQQFKAHLDAHRDVGGPDIPVNPAQEIGVADPGFQQAYLKASLTLDRLDELLTGMGHVPLIMPVWGKQFVFTSGYGPRIDPFNGHVSFHPGLDFAGPYGAVVRSTAPGKVIMAQFSSSYGNFVEIDHGLGIHTKYGHLSALLVKPGDKVQKGTPIGKLGSTGRSTGPHVHYEVRYNGATRNPRNFIEAGRYVLKQG